MSATLSPSEWKTRRTLVDPRLAAAGWPVPSADATTATVPAHTTALTEYPTGSGPADYVLCHGGRVVGIVEAKRLAVSPAGVLTQAQRYAEGVTGCPFDFGGARVPFLYSTNGEVIHFHDARDPLNLSRKVKRFHTPAALEELLARDFAKACDWFATNHNTHPRLRPYQREANAAVEKAISDHKRTVLLAMATGTGTTTSATSSADCSASTRR